VVKYVAFLLHCLLCTNTSSIKQIAPIISCVFYLLGAVAGIADHSIQNLLQPDTEGEERGSAASGIVTGMGKGLVGVLTKPIGGAAEFVSLTGQGT